MNIKEAIERRISIRSFHARPVQKDILMQIMTAALRAPSWGNTQSWGFHVVSGRPLELIKEEFHTLMSKDEEAAPEVAMPNQWNDTQTARYQGVGKMIFEALGIGREEKDKRGAFYLDMFKFFGAPHMIFLHLQEGFNSYALLDCGLILQTIALLAIEQGLGTCLMAAAVSYPEVVRRHAKIPENRKLILGTAIGYPVNDHPVNQIRTQRGKPEEFIQWIEG